MALLDYLRLPFREAIDFLRARINVPTDNFAQTLGLDFRVFFAVSSARGSLLSELRRAVDLAIERGESLASFRARFGEITARAGWQPGRTEWRSRLIWETNFRAAHAAGRTQQMNSATSARPYWIWRHGRSREPRLAHKAMDGLVFRHDDPLWTWCDPPHGFGCKCTKFSLSERDVKRMGLLVRTGPLQGEEVGGHPLLAEPGWSSHRPLSPADRAAAIDRAASRMSPAIAEQFRREINL